MNKDNGIVRVTLDTNVPQELWREQEKKQVVEELLRYFEAGRISLAVTTRIENDIPYPPLSNRISELSEAGVETIGTLFRWGESSWGSGDYWVTEAEAQAEDKLRTTILESNLTMPGDADIDHILGHYIAKRDIFLTWDGAIRSAADVCREVLGVHIATPEAFLAQLDDEPA